MNNITPKSSTPGMPLIVFKVGKMTCAVDGASVISIQRMEEFTLTPHTPDEIFGSINFRNHVISILDLRTVFGLPTRIKEYSDFIKMLDQRKQDHINWVNTLKESVRNNTRFPLTTCPHQCAFGKWYDKYDHPNKKIMFHMERIREPHNKLHYAALDVAKIQEKDCPEDEKNEQIQEILRQVENEYMVTVVGLLDSAKTIFKDIYQTMLIVLEDIQQIAIAVDEVVAVTNLEEVVVEKESLMYGSMVQRFLKGKNDDDIIYHLNQEALFKRLMNNMR
jgi:Chemotaxis signal transduction protein